MSNGFIYVADAHFIDKIEEKNIYPGPKWLWMEDVIRYVYQQNKYIKNIQQTLTRSTIWISNRPKKIKICRRPSNDYYIHVQFELNQVSKKKKNPSIFPQGWAKTSIFPQDPC